MRKIMLFMINHVSVSKAEGCKQRAKRAKQFFLTKHWVLFLFFCIINVARLHWCLKLNIKDLKMCMHGTFKVKRRCYVLSVYCVAKSLAKRFYQVSALTFQCQPNVSFFLFLPLRWKTQNTKTKLTLRHFTHRQTPSSLLLSCPASHSCATWSCMPLVNHFLSTETLFVCEGHRGSEDRRHSGIVTACKTSFSCMYKQFCCKVATSVWLLSDDGRCYFLQHWHLHLKPWVNVPMKK